MTMSNSDEILGPSWTPASAAIHVLLDVMRPDINLIAHAKGVAKLFQRILPTSTGATTLRPSVCNHTMTSNPANSIHKTMLVSTTFSSQNTLQLSSTHWLGKKLVLDN